MYCYKMASTATEHTATCLVCYETRPLKIVGNCKHSFCTECLSTVFESLDSGSEVFACPTCKVDCPRPWNGVKGLVDYFGVKVSSIAAAMDQRAKPKLPPKPKPQIVEKNPDKKPPTVEMKPDKKPPTVPMKPDKKPPTVEMKPDKKPPTVAMKPDKKPPTVAMKPDKKPPTVKKKPQSKPQIAEIKCQLCRHKKKDVLAVSMCKACGHFYFCQDCTDTHASKPATKNHSMIVLTAAVKEEDATVCEVHETYLSSFCQTCRKAVCAICVLEDHGDHLTQELGETIDLTAAQLKTALEKPERRLTKLQGLQEELYFLQGEARNLDRQDTLIKEIEDHAQKCTDQIVKWKEDLKAQIKADFKIITDVPKGLEKVSEVVQKFEVVTRATKFLRETEHHPVYLNKLIALKQELDDIDGIGGDTEEMEFRNKLQALHRNNHTFVPREMPTSFGKVDKSSGRLEFKPKKIFIHTIQVDDEGMFIPCVANLGEKFAVAHPTKRGKYSNAIDIYEFPGTLVKTLRDHVPPIYDMSTTPDGKLAVLSNGTVDSSCSVQLFDPETGYIRSTCDITDVTKPLSLGVTLQNQYVILRDNKGQKEITVVDKDGAVLHKHLIEARVTHTNPNRITCGGRFIFVKGHKHVAVFEVKDTGLQVIQTGIRSIALTTKNLKDISATVWDDFMVTSTCIYSKRLDLDLYPDKNNTSNWSRDGFKTVRQNVTEIEEEGQVSVRDGHIVVSYGQTIKVYKL